VVVSKGYYVRALARDVGERLAIPTHLAALRRMSSGPFSIESAVSLEDLPGVADRALVPLATAATQALSVGRLTDRGAARARWGQTLDLADFEELPPVGEASAWLDSLGRLVAVGRRDAIPATRTPDERGESAFAIHRGFLR
jgi:tRNA pseudouridine55 synthase